MRVLRPIMNNLILYNSKQENKKNRLSIELGGLKFIFAFLMQPKINQYVTFLKKIFLLF